KNGPRRRRVGENESRPPTPSGAAENRIEPPPPEAGNRVPQVSGSEAVGAAEEQRSLANRREIEELHQQDSARKTGPTSMTRSNPAAMADPHLVADPRAELADEHACRILPAFLSLHSYLGLAGGSRGRRRTSASCSAGMGVGAPVRGSAPDWVLGKVMTSRIEGAPASSMKRRSRPKAKRPRGGAP